MDVPSITSDCAHPTTMDTKDHPSTNPSSASVFHEKQRLLEVEKSELIRQLELSSDDHNKRQESLITRYFNADYLLSQWEYLLPSKRLLSTRQTSNSSACQLGHDSVFGCKHLLEPASNMVYSKMYTSTRDAQSRVRQSNDDLLAWKFDPESAGGKRLMTRMRQLLNENEILGRANQTEQLATLETETEAQTKCITEFTKAHEGIEGVLEEAHLDLDGLQNNLLMLQQQITEAESVIQIIQAEIELRKPGRVAELVKSAWNKVGAAQIHGLGDSQMEFTGSIAGSSLSDSGHSTTRVTGCATDCADVERT